MADHSEFVELHANAVTTNYLRIAPELLHYDIRSLYAYPEELLLCVVHSNDGKLLMLSNRRIIIYKIPTKRSIFRRAGGAVVSIATSMTIDAIPVVSEISTVLDGIGAAKTIRNRFAKSEAGMPSKRDVKNLVWDLDDSESCRMVVCYKDRILLENSFDWDVDFEVTLEKALKKRTNIAIGAAEIRGRVGGKKASFSLANPQISYVQFARKLVVNNIDAFQAAGWQPAVEDNALVLKK